MPDNVFEAAKFATVLDETQRRLSTLNSTLDNCRGASSTPRVQLLATAFQTQVKEITAVVERVRSQVSARGLGRSVALNTPWIPFTDLPDAADSRALTLWLVQSLNALASRYQSIAEAKRLGGLESTVAELQQLFAAQAKRIAMEANRFEDL